jgi:hypothetical protein
LLSGSRSAPPKAKGDLVVAEREQVADGIILPERREARAEIGCRRRQAVEEGGAVRGVNALLGGGGRRCRRCRGRRRGEGALEELQEDGGKR